jgi:hypothetical protein
MIVSFFGQMPWPGPALMRTAARGRAPGVLLCSSLEAAWVSGNHLIRVIRWSAQAFCPLATSRRSSVSARITMTAAMTRAWTDAVVIFTAS